MRLNEIFEIWTHIYKSWRYPLVAVLVSFTFYLLNILILNWNFVFGSWQNIGNFLPMIFSMPMTFKVYSFIGLIVVSLLFGFLFSLIFYKVNFFKDPSERKSGFFGIIGSGVFGAFTGIFATGCAACGVGLVSILGISAGFLSVFPYHGFEFTILSILMLVFAIVKISKNMYFCNLKKGN